jgi:FKBP-type peptidyl-prolyl cis-trans isomerase FkpA
MIHINSLENFIFSGLLVLISFTSCNPTKKWKEMEEEEKLAIQEYLSDNDTINFELKTSGLYYYDVKVGTGALAETHDTAYMFYTMSYLSGTVFETTIGTNDTLIFPVNEGWLSVKGFDEAATYMKEGGKSKFLVPSSLAFGASGTYYIASYTPFIFDAELVKLVKYTGKK